MPPEKDPKKVRNPNAEIEEYRSLMEVPKSFREGFTLRTIMGVIFISVVMVPGNIYLSLMTGGSIGAAAEWVTIILFIEIARRSFTTLSRQEIYLLFYVAVSLIAAETGTFQGLLWNQYLVQSEAARQFGISHLIPHWVAPPLGSEALVNRTFFHSDWLLPIGLLIAGMLIGRVSWFTIGYSLFRVTSDVERLPFPFAPISAQGALALADSSSGEETWRWRMFSTGVMIGAGFGALYVAVPAITGAMLAEPVMIFPIPFADFTHDSGYVLPATPLGLSFNLGIIITGLLAPFWGVVGAVAGSLTYVAACPILHANGLLPSWQLGMGSIETYFINNVDFWMSFSFGITFAIALVGFYQVYVGTKKRRSEMKGSGSGVMKTSLPEGRGDFSIPLLLGLFSLVTIMTIGIARWMLPGFPWLYFVFFGFIFTPFLSFVNARLIGMVGQSLSIPYIKEGAIFLSGYRGVEVWFVPFALENYGAQAQRFREIELTGTKFTSILKAEVFMVPVVLLTSFIYWQYLWQMAPIPSATYPYAQTMWRLQALQQCLWFSSTLRGEMEVEGERGSWRPANLPDGERWYWRACLRDEEGKRGEWSEVGMFETRFGESFQAEAPASEAERLLKEVELHRASPSPRTEGTALAGFVVPGLISPPRGEIVRTPTPNLAIRIPDGIDEDLIFVEVDTEPTFQSRMRQTSDDEPLLLKAIKWPVIGTGLAVGLGLFIISGIFGLPTLLVWGYAHSMNTMPHFVLPSIIGALLARYYFWNKYGKKQWRLYAVVLSVGFAAGMSLMAMISIGIALIHKSVSPLIF